MIPSSDWIEYTTLAASAAVSGGLLDSPTSEGLSARARSDQLGVSPRRPLNRGGSEITRRQLVKKNPDTTSQFLPELEPKTEPKPQLEPQPEPQADMEEVEEENPEREPEPELPDDVENEMGSDTTVDEETSADLKEEDSSLAQSLLIQELEKYDVTTIFALRGWTDPQR